ncbi:P-loop containing nucleoside triphosphate hydrolase protein [Lentinula edodes]|uniref:P-loop containing nucleoside triphosphate hydrolase protein n=1 Tax=Lentinula edodes TaxID=5353 RepID=UPI001E8D9AB6|nr:P-loop containing nucleoside triphosphate hydrolase protein [Lentinula edodes]KAH7873423.1 P-loop containing nucleoside triphosphate hydrolase protein [Lentinula edodes]
MDTAAAAAAGPKVIIKSSSIKTEEYNHKILQAVQGKTKAKQRYLKRKKERRKLNNKNNKNNQKKTSVSQSQVGDEEEGTETEDEEVEVEMQEVDEEVTVPEEREKRPKKRRKFSIELEDVEMHSESLAPPPAHSIQRSPTPQAALPTFPLPALPNPPSKATLALQGLDKALVDADIISPSKTLHIPPDGNIDGGTGLSEKMRKRLVDLGITELFAVQTSLLPFLLPSDPMHRALYQPYNPPRDVCVSAPTGSGKTLAYVVPIILSSRIVTRLRALVVLPTRDLVMQVRETFETISKGRGLKIGTATGQHSFPHEQAQLVADHSTSLRGGSSKVDILICTPGRLIDHLKETPNFSLQHLRFLVVDEADRLLAQSFQDWLIQVLAATRPPKNPLKHTLKDLADTTLTPRSDTTPNPTPDALAPAFLHLLPYPDVPSFITERKAASCQKLLFSATLTRDPGKIAALELRIPKYFIVQGSSPDEQEDAILDVVTEKFTMPDTLKEHMIICSAYEKPLVFFHLVHAHDITNALVFTKSAESTNRLVQLLDFFQNARTSETSNYKNIVVQAYSSDLPTAERKAVLDKFKSQEIQILVCSDLISRGIDISHVSHVISYDSPVDMRKYVHRVGRTARAGREGDAWTLVEEQEARHFKLMMKDAHHLSEVKRLRIGEKQLAPLIPHYETALSHLKDLYSRS